MARLVTRLARCAVISTMTSKSLHPVSRFISTCQCLQRPVSERLYTEKHEWIKIDDKIGTVGISEYAQEALGDVVYAQLPDVGSLIKKDEECGALESVKAASELFSPLSGKVVEKNEAVENKPNLINTSCYEEGWLFKIAIAEMEQVENLMNEKSYEEYLKTDPH